jgi:hypothetical protein
MNNRDKIIGKIKKCLALSASSNEHEAAAALQHAKKLMEAHGISDLDMQAAEATEARARAGAVKSPANWEACLAGTIADAFACRIIFTYNGVSDCGEWAFIGTGAAPEVAEYAFRVLFRQAKTARAEHIKTRLKRCKPGTKTRRADLYSEGWVRSVTARIDGFASGETNPQAVDAYMASKYPSLGTLQSRNRNAERNLRPHEEMDYLHGSQAGRNAQLNRGVGGNATPLALE